MSGEGAEPPEPAPEARIVARRPFHYVWLVPVVAAVIAVFLAVQAVVRAGPTISLTFTTAEGLTPGQTKIRHKAVELGTVSAIRLDADNHHVVVRASMQGEAAQYLTDQARFWVVRPRLSAGNVSGLDTVLSGAYIEMDPGSTRGGKKLSFEGLDEPPTVRSDEPGTEYVVQAARLGSLSSGSPVFFRDIVVGEVLRFEAQPADLSRSRTIPVHVFIRKPFNELVKQGTQFWNASGIAFELGAQGLRVRLASLQALLSGGIAFDTPEDARQNPLSPPGSEFDLLPDQAAAATAGFHEKIPFLIYVHGSVRGLAVGAPVELFGIQIGTVTDIHLLFDPTGANSRVAIRLEVQPERIMGAEQIRADNPLAVSTRLVAQGLRVQLRSANLLTGQLVVAFDFFQDGQTPQVIKDGDAIVLPSVPGGLDSITANLGEILRKIDAMPLEQIGRNLNDTLAGARGVATAPELRQSLRSLATALAAAEDLFRKLDSDAGPAFHRLPDIAQSLQTAVDRAGKLVGSVDSGYGDNSQFRRDMQRLLEQVSDTARSVRLLADYLDSHPESLLRGRDGRAGGR